MIADSVLVFFADHPFFFPRIVLRMRLFQYYLVLGGRSSAWVRCRADITRSFCGKQDVLFVPVFNFRQEGCIVTDSRGQHITEYGVCLRGTGYNLNVAQLPLMVFCGLFRRFHNSPYKQL